MDGIREAMLRDRSVKTPAVEAEARRMSRRRRIEVWQARGRKSNAIGAHLRSTMRVVPTMQQERDGLDTADVEPMDLDLVTEGQSPARSMPQSSRR